MEISWDIYVYKNIPIAKQGEKEDLQNKTDMIFSWLLVLVGTYAKSCANELKTRNEFLSAWLMVQEYTIDEFTNNF